MFVRSFTSLDQVPFRRFYERTSDASSTWKDENGNYEIRVYIPGYGKEDLKVLVRDDTVKITVKESSNLSYTYRFPKTHDPKQARVVVDKGIATLTVPKVVTKTSEEVEILVE